MIFQDPYASLNPRLKVMDIVAEGIDIHKLARDKKDRKRRVYDLLETVGLSKEHANRYPHEFSGGQLGRRERISGVLTLIAWTIIVTGSSAWCTWISLPHNGNGISMVMLIIPILLAVVCSFIYFLTSKMRAAV